MENDRTRILGPDDEGLTRGIFDFGPPDETLDEASHVPASSASISMKSDQIRLNRHFLEDAAPFELDGFGQTVQARSARLQILDQPEISVPHESLTVLHGGEGSGKSCLLMNLLWRLGELYPKHHFLYFSFERSKPDVFLRLMALGSPVAPVRIGNLDDNLLQWRKLLLEEDPQQLKKRSTIESPLAGLATLLQNGHRLHVVDRLSDGRGLISSLETFAKSLPLAAVFIDGGEWLLYSQNRGQADLKNLLSRLRQAARTLGVAIIITLNEISDEAMRSSTLTEVVGKLSKPWGGGGEALMLEWQDRILARAFEIPLLAHNQRIVWDRVTIFQGV